MEVERCVEQFDRTQHACNDALMGSVRDETTQQNEAIPSTVMCTNVNWKRSAKWGDKRVGSGTPNGSIACRAPFTTIDPPSKT